MRPSEHNLLKEMKLRRMKSSEADGEDGTSISEVGAAQRGDVSRRERRHCERSPAADHTWLAERFRISPQKLETRMPQRNSRERQSQGAPMIRRWRWRRRTKTKLTPRRRQRLLETSGGSEQRTIINGNTVIGDGDTNHGS